MRTALYDHHIALDAKMTDFGGWEMPVQYTSILAEHKAVREKVGMCDVSHMGRVTIEGTDAEPFLNYLSTNRIAGKKELTATYTVWATPDGGCVDDVIVYRCNPNRFFVIVNAANRLKDLQHLVNESQLFDVEVYDRYDDYGIIAVQGPEALEIAGELFEEVRYLRPMRFLPARFHHQNVILSGTGYTGAGGCEVYGPEEAIVALWEALLERNVTPVGLGARDTLRLEMGFALYGHELSEKIAPTESVASWTVKWDHADFIGKEALLKLESSPEKRSEVGLVLIDRGIGREGCEVYQDDQQIGMVTSGTFSPTLEKGIAIALVKGSLQEGDTVEVQIRGKRCQARVTPLPFVTMRKE